MRFLLDEDVPLGLRKALEVAGHDVVRVKTASSDPEVARNARAEARILVTLDKDFTNAKLYAPTTFTIVHIRIHPPYEEDVVNAFQDLLKTLPLDQFHGLILLTKAGYTRVLE
jgi:predicted nuclease of predicted toxin-antitoxin system